MNHAQTLVVLSHPFGKSILQCRHYHRQTPSSRSTHYCSLLRVYCGVAMEDLPSFMATVIEIEDRLLTFFIVAGNYTIIAIANINSFFIF